MIFYAGILFIVDILCMIFVVLVKPILTMLLILCKAKTFMENYNYTSDMLSEHLLDYSEI